MLFKVYRVMQKCKILMKMDAKGLIRSKTETRDTLPSKISLVSRHTSLVSPSGAKGLLEGIRDAGKTNRFVIQLQAPL